MKSTECVAYLVVGKVSYLSHMDDGWTRNLLGVLNQESFLGGGLVCMFLFPWLQPFEQETNITGIKPTV